MAVQDPEQRRASLLRRLREAVVHRLDLDILQKNLSCAVDRENVDVTNYIKSEKRLFRLHQATLKLTSHGAIFVQRDARLSTAALQRVERKRLPLPNAQDVVGWKKNTG